MSLIGSLFGSGIGKTVTQVAGAFRPNAEARDARQDDLIRGAQAELAAEFGTAPTGILGRLADGLNRLIRPLIALAVLYALADAWRNPDHFASVMDAYARAPEELWQSVTAVFALYTGSRIHARHVRYRLASKAKRIEPAKQPPADKSA